MFNEIPSALRQLFYGEFIASHGEVIKADEQVTDFLNEVQKEIYNNAEFGISL